MLYAYKDCKFNKSNEEELIINLKEVYYFYKEKKLKQKRDLKMRNYFYSDLKKLKN